MNNISILSSLFVSDSSSQVIDTKSSENSDFESFLKSFAHEQSKISSISDSDKSKLSKKLSSENFSSDKIQSKEISDKLNKVLSKDNNHAISQFSSNVEEVANNDEVASSLAALIMMMTNSQEEIVEGSENNLDVFEKLVSFIQDSSELSLESLREESKELLAGLSALFSKLNENISVDENIIQLPVDSNIHMVEDSQVSEQPKTILELLSLLKTAKQQEKYNKEAEKNALKKVADNDSENNKNNDEEENKENLLSQISLLTQEVDIKDLSLNNTEVASEDNSKILNKLYELISILSGGKDNENLNVSESNKEASQVVDFTESLLVLKKELENILNTSSKDLQTMIDKINPQVIPSDNFLKTGSASQFLDVVKNQVTPEVVIENTKLLNNQVSTTENQNIVANKDNNFSETLLNNEDLENQLPLEENNIDNDENIKLADVTEEVLPDDATLENMAKDGKNQKSEKGNEVLSSLKKENLKGDNLEVKESVKGGNEEKFSVEAKFASKEKSNNSEAFLSNENKPQEKVATQSNSLDLDSDFNALMKEASNAPKTESKQVGASSYTSYDLKEPKDISRLVRTLESTVNKGESKLTVTLRPDDLGRLEIRLIETGGKINAKFFADNETSYRMMLSHGDAIKAQLAEKGIVIDNMEFAFNDTTSKQGTGEEKKSAKYNGNKKSFKDNDDENKEVGTDFASNKKTGIYA